MAGKGFRLADAYVDVHGDGTEVVTDVAKDVDKGAPKAKASGMGLAKGFVGGFVAYEGFKKAGEFIGDSIGAASNLNETVSASQAIFGRSAGSISSWAENAATKFGLSKQAAIEAATGFGDMFQQIGFTQTAATRNSKSIVQMATDLGSFKNLPTGEVLDMISGAMRGEYDSLQRVIPNINAARVEHEALTESGKKQASQLTAQEKAQATMNIIQKDGSRAMGDFAKTSGGAANQTKIMQAQTEDLKASLGTSLLPVVKTLMGVFTTVFLPILKGIADWIGKNQALIGPLVIILGILAAAIWVVNIALDANPIVLIIMGIMALIAAVVLLVTNWDAVVKFLTVVWQGFITWVVGVIIGFVGWWNGVWAGFGAWIASVWNGFIGWIRGLWQGFINWVVAVVVGFNAIWAATWNLIGATIRNIWNGFISWIRAVWQGFISWILAVVSGFVGGWNALWSRVGSFINSVWSNVVNFARGAWNGLIGWFRSIPGMIMGVFNGAMSWLGSIGRNIVQGLWNGLRGAWDNFMSWWNGIVGGITDVAKALLGIHSPSTVMYEIGVNTVLGAENAIKDRKFNLHRAVRDTFDITGNVNASGTAAEAFSAGTEKGKPKGGGDTYVVHITLDASKFADVQQALDTLKKIGQTARQGQGQMTAPIGA
jgi:hypothetical protein